MQNLKSIKKGRNMKKNRSIILCTMIALLLAIGCSLNGSLGVNDEKASSLPVNLKNVTRAETQVNLIKNPYSSVNWSTYNQFKSNYHTHTTNSDGSQTPSTVINEYYAKGYSILSITDHNYTTWPWPHNPGILAVRGNEYSSSHHMNAMLNFTTNSSNLDNGIPHVQSNSGISQINHPGRYNSPSNWSWYIPWFRDYSTCSTLEVYNQGDRYPNDRKLWDNINENLFAQSGKFVWGTSNDDKHSSSHLYGNFNFMLMPDLTEASFKESMAKGAFYFCYEPGRTGNANVPRISNIVVDNNTKNIIVTATGFNSIQWIGPGTNVVGTGSVFNYSTYTNKPFVRAVLGGSNGDSFTQPFGFETINGSNTPPTCSITSPENNASFTAPANIIINTNAADNDGNITKVEFYNGTTKLGEDLTYPYSFTWPNVAAGNYKLTAKATDNKGASTTSSTVSVTVKNSGSTTVIVSKRISSGNDDVEENKRGGIYRNSSDLELVYDGSRRGNQTVGLRFKNLNIPQGVTILKAYIQFTCDERKSGSTSVVIKGHDVNNSVAFTTSYYNVSSRTKTSASVEWNNISAWNTVGAATSKERTPELKSIVQEIVNRRGFTTSSAMTFIITGTGKRTAESYNGSKSKAPLLYIEYLK